jgi:hypothetical protein
MAVFTLESLVLASRLGCLRLKVPADIRLCHPGLDPGSSGVRGTSKTDAGGSPAASHFRRDAKESKQRKATPLHRPFWAPFNCDAIQKTAVILSEAEGSAVCLNRYASVPQQRSRFLDVARNDNLEGTAGKREPLNSHVAPPKFGASDGGSPRALSEGERNQQPIALAVPRARVCEWPGACAKFWEPRRGRLICQLRGRLYSAYFLLAKQKKVSCCRATPGFGRHYAANATGPRIKSGVTTSGLTASHHRNMT